MVVGVVAMEDNSYRKSRNPNPRETASWLSIITFFYTIPAFISAQQKEILVSDVPQTLTEHKSRKLRSIIVNLWKNEIKTAKSKFREPSLKRVLIKAFGWNYFQLSAVTAVIEFLVKPYQAIVLSDLISFYADYNHKQIPSNIFPYKSAAAIIICSFLYIIISNLCILGSYHLGMKIRISCSNLMYRKVLKLGKSAYKETTPGQIINLFTNDLNIFDKFTLTTHYIWIAPVQSILIFWILYRQVGVSSVYGILLLLLSIFLFVFVGKLMKKIRLRASTVRDERIRLMNEIIHGIKEIKMYVWEKLFTKMVMSKRSREIKAITRLSYLKGTFLFYRVFISTSIFVTLAIAIFLKNEVSAKNVFLFTNLYYVLGTSMTLFFVQGIALLVEVTVSINRLTRFLLLDEISKISQHINDGNIVIRDGSVAWEDKIVLSGFNIRIQSGRVTAVIGPVGSGKSTLLQLILREKTLESGSVNVHGSVSYAPQEPWIFPGSIKQNILFGSKLDAKRYLQVIKVCALADDFELLPCGDKSIVGNRGAALSGGQKARINLARAIYRHADIYLLDDPFSAIDVKVSKQILQDCVKTFLKGKTVLLCTHQIHYAEYADNVLVVENNSVKEDFEKEFSYFPQTNGFENTSHSEEVSKRNVDMEKQEDEKKATGFIPTAVYKNYVFACQNKILVITTFSVLILTQFAFSGSFWFIALFVNLMKRSDYEEFHLLYICIYCFITAAHILLTALSCWTFIKLAMRSSKELHIWMYLRIIRTTLEFFNRNPSGRIINRFTKDLTTMDEIIPNTILSAVRTMLSILGILVVICSINPWFLVPTVTIGTIFFYLKKIFLTTSLALMRIDSITRSPLYGHLSATLQGLPVIRAFQVQNVLTDELHEHQDLQSSALYSYLAAGRAFGLWTDGICFIYLIIVTVYYTTIGNVSEVGNVGLAITQSLQLIGQLQMGIKQMIEVENNMVSVERILEYTELNRERSIGIKPPSSWPSKGQLTFLDVFLKYNPQNPYALKNINFTIRAQEKIGVIGRTGAGKSSLIVALFELAQMEGAIVIDQINTKKLKLRDFRKKLSVIPQDPFLFSGTIRNNLDPFHEYGDDLLWQKLEEVKLKDLISDLDLEVSQNGKNFSVGQRQLICLARALLRQNKILILDEATANVDKETDSIVQGIIKKHFSSCTVITIAHRLSTILESDRIMVMKEGEVVEFDRPNVLLSNEKSLLYEMVQQTKTLSDNNRLINI